MLFHMSIDADDPANVARVIAELWHGACFPFPPINEGSWIAFAGDERNSAIEIYRRGVELFPVDGDEDAEGRMNAAAGRHRSTHVAIATPLDREEVIAIAAREGWLAKYRKRGDVFGVIEFWVENSFMLEVLTPEMQAEYLATMTIDGWRGFLSSMDASAAA